MLPRVFIIILNWNGYHDTIECIESLKKVDYPNFEIVVVDNGSTNESVKEIKARHSDVLILEAGKNLGFAGGNNFGIRVVENKGDCFLILNNDTTVEPDFLKVLVEEAENRAEVGIIGPRMNYWTEPNVIWFNGGKTNWLKTKGVHLGYNKNEELIRSKSGELPKFCDYITGCALLIKKEVVEKIGLMDENYFLYFEDVDWCLRAKKAGYKCLVVPQAKIYHKVSRSSRPGSFNYIYYNVRNSFYMSRKFSNVSILPLIYFLSLMQFKKELLKFLFSSKRIWARASIKGIWDFWRGRMNKI